MQAKAAKIAKDTRLSGKNKRREKMLRPTERSAAKARSKVEMEMMQDYFFEQSNKANITHRILAWSAGHISSQELHADMKVYNESRGLRYRVP